MRRRVGIIGMGFVGNAVAKGLGDVHNIFCYDKQGRYSTVDFDAFVERSEVFFIVVPTPTNFDTLEQDLSAVEDVCLRLRNSPEFDIETKIVVLKSTVLPGTTDRLREHYGFRIVFNPEFLREKTAQEDFLNPARIILGGPPEDTSAVKDVYLEKFADVDEVNTNYFALVGRKQTHYVLCSAVEAEMVKYMSNCFLATKVSAFNEFHQLCEKIGARYDVCRDAIVLDERVGKWGTVVPGDDGLLGFGGSCFPKDLASFIGFSDKLCIDSKVLRAAWEKNLEVRKRAE